MTFYEMLEQVIALLQRHGRLSYRALKVQLDITPSGRTMPLDRHIPSCSHYSLGIPPWA
jgi:hypothetical protein